MKKTLACLLASVALGTFAGCQGTDTASNKPKKTGSYAAARHSSVGSNIPQRENVDSTGATYDPDQFQNVQGQRAAAAGMGGGVGGAR